MRGDDRGPRLDVVRVGCFSLLLAPDVSRKTLVFVCEQEHNFERGLLDTGQRFCDYVLVGFHLLWCAAKSAASSCPCASANCVAVAVNSLGELHPRAASYWLALTPDAPGSMQLSAGSRDKVCDVSLCPRRGLHEVGVHMWMWSLRGSHDHAFPCVAQAQPFVNAAVDTLRAIDAGTFEPSLQRVNFLYVRCVPHRCVDWGAIVAGAVHYLLPSPYTCYDVQTGT